MKVFRIETKGESDWVCAENVIQALKKYEEITDVGLIHFDKSDTITEVPVSEWHHITIVSDNGSTTISKYMKTADKADIICSTACIL